MIGSSAAALGIPPEVFGLLGVLLTVGAGIAKDWWRSRQEERAGAAVEKRDQARTAREDADTAFRHLQGLVTALQEEVGVLRGGLEAERRARGEAEALVSTLRRDLGDAQEECRSLRADAEVMRTELEALRRQVNH